MAIRYDKRFNAEIARVVKNFNRKVMRLKGMERVLAPHTVLVSELKQQYQKRNDLKRRLRELELFSERGIEEEVLMGDKSTTKYQVKLDKRRAQRAKTNLTREIKKAERSVHTANSGYVRNLRRRREFLDKPIESLTPKQLKIRENVINRESDMHAKQELFYKNFFQMIYKTAYMVGMEAGDVEKALHVFRNFTPAELADAVDTMPEMSAFSLKYKALELVGETGKGLIASALNLLTDSASKIKEFYQPNS